jgi:anti-repressor protein
MNELVFRGANDQALTNSLLVAEKFGKEHKNVIRDIKELSCSQNFRELNFELSFTIRQLPNGGHKQEPMYIMTKDGFSFLVMGYTGEQAGKFKEEYINAFNGMEKRLQTGGFQIPQTFAQALQLAAIQAKEIEDKNRLIESQIPKVVFADAVESTKDSILIGDLAKILKQRGVDTGEKRLFAWMRGNHYLCSYGERYNHPTQSAMEMKLFEVSERAIGSGENFRMCTTTKVTGKGQLYFINKFLNKGIQA